ncbi:hypothetical protein P280DRAFT_395343 [Massarina eburnea CBS 473.64]|uniref:Uncharacterized protein n=1 Tax=Massarina eburnea CBS 473.64 TaxID=1395130 RepID=A0A6A6S6T0_9PLEO|nr:hypothetical protein P280DRAFT_395343 [Massarina eburnea CBS 473.64]
MIFNVLPAVVQNRIPAIPSIRRTISDFRSPGRSVSVAEETVHYEDVPATCTSRPNSARSSLTRHSIDPLERELPVGECVPTRSQSSPGTPHSPIGTPHSPIGTPPPFLVPERRTGINWKYANQGVSLTSQAYAESHTLAARNDDTSTTLTRQLYIHGMTYLLRGLPSDLTPEETMSIQAATPPSAAMIQIEPCNHAVVPFMQETPVPQEPPADPSTLHRITAMIVFQAFVMIEFLLPYIKLFAGHAYRFEREHKVMQRLVNNGLVTADALRRRSLQLSHTICQMNGGRVGQALNDLIIWWVRGLTGGLQQGITEGVTMMSGERPRGERPRTAKRLEKED